MPGAGEPAPRGRRPVRIAGTASTEKSATVFASRYQVAVSARRAKFGYSRRSRRRRSSSSETSGSSSKTTITTGAPVEAALTGSGPGPAKTIVRTGETTRNSSRTTTGAAPRRLNQDRAARERRYSQIATPAAATCRRDGRWPADDASSRAL